MMKLAIAQINPTVGDIAGNAAKILDYYQRARLQGAELIICPELSLIGYPPEDLILMPAFRREAMQAVEKLAAKTAGGPALIVGSPWEENGLIYNAAILLDGGKIVHVQPKTILPNYGIFDEKRIFAEGSGPKVVQWRNHRLGLLICEDIWADHLSLDLKKQGAELLIVINASPFESGKLQQRKEVAARAVKASGLPLIYVNTVGGQDDIVFDGGSFMMAADAQVVYQLPEFEEVLVVYCHPAGREASAQDLTRSCASLPLAQDDRLWQAMCLGLGDYGRKNGFSGVVLGLSGGIDSALSAAVAVDALGAANVKGVLLPSPYTAKESIEDALESARLLGIKTMSVPITPGMEIFEEVLSPVFKKTDWMEDVTVGGNVQSRLRGMTLMAISNRFGWLLLSTGNKSEIAVGYSTLYGDSCGGYNVLKDVYKTQVYTLAQWRNEKKRVIPQHSITKAPSAELAPGQKDEDQLPPYALLDRILALHLEGRQSAEEIIAQGFDKATVEKVVKLVRQSEYKRRQSCPGVKLSPMLFGRDRRFPLTNKF